MLSDLIDVERYPIFNPSSKDYQTLAKSCQTELQKTGLCVLEGFVRPEALERMIRESRAAEAVAFHSTVYGNAYLSSTNPELSPDHAYNIKDHTTLGVVAYDQIGPEAVIRRIYEDRGVLNFLGSALGREVHYYECPMGKINYSMMKHDDYLRWHFDHSDFVVAIPIQSAAEGGVYEYVYNIRSAEDERFDDVKKVLLGDRSNVQILQTPPGSLVLFEGRYTIHRVTPIKGPVTRIMGLLGYADRPGVTSTEYLRKIRYGRV